MCVCVCTLYILYICIYSICVCVSTHPADFRMALTFYIPILSSGRLVTAALPKVTLPACRWESSFSKSSRFCGECP